MILLQKLMSRLQAPAKDGGDLSGAGEGTAVNNEDYGDDFTPTGDDDESAAGGKAADKGGNDADPDGAGDGAAGGDGDEAGGEEGSELRAGADAIVDGEGEQKKDTGTPKTVKGKFIPLDRHEKLLKKERAKREELEAQLSQSRAGQEMAQANDKLERIENELVDMETKYNELLGEGDVKGAAELMTKIRHKNAELNSITSQQREAESAARAVEQARYKETLDRIEESYPELDKESDEYDEELVQDVADLTRTNIGRGMSPSKALQRAVQRLLGVDDGAQRRATSVTPRVDESAAAKRRSEAVKRNIDASKRTPPATHRAGSGNDTAGGALTAETVKNMSEEEFAKLTEKDLSKLRGDTL